MRVEMDELSSPRVLESHSANALSVRLLRASARRMRASVLSRSDSPALQTHRDSLDLLMMTSLPEIIANAPDYVQLNPTSCSELPSSPA